MFDGGVPEEWPFMFSPLLDWCDKGCTPTGDARLASSLVFKGNSSLDSEYLEALHSAEEENSDNGFLSLNSSIAYLFGVLAVAVFAESFCMHSLQ